MPAGRLLLVAPDTDLRRSLVFSLETEDYALTVRDTPPSRDWLARHRPDCTILDQKALSGPQYEAIAFCIKAHPVVLLAAQPHDWLVQWVVEAVQLPLAGTDVTAAIRHALHIDA
jgi:DNA-binding response OmpR family regulator